MNKQEFYANLELAKKKDSLEHHGILGQKWGVRRYQNPDGTLTDLGRKRLDQFNAFKAVAVPVAKKMAVPVAATVGGAMLGRSIYETQYILRLGQEIANTYTNEKRNYNLLNMGSMVTDMIESNIERMNIMKEKMDIMSSEYDEAERNIKEEMERAEERRYEMYQDRQEFLSEYNKTNDEMERFRRENFK